MGIFPSDAGGGDFGFEFLLPEAAKGRPEMAHIADIIKLDSDSTFEFSEKVARALSAAAGDGPGKEDLFNKKRGVIAKNINRFIERFNVKVKDVRTAMYAGKKSVAMNRSGRYSGLRSSWTREVESQGVVYER